MNQQVFSEMRQTFLGVVIFNQCQLNMLGNAEAPFHPFYLAGYCWILNLLVIMRVRL